MTDAVPAETNDGGDRRARILRIAAEEFAHRGRAAVRVDEIARRAKVNKALIYYYFTSKDDLFTAVLELMVDDRAPLWEEVRGSTLHEGLATLMRPRPSNEIDFERMLLWEGLEHGTGEGGADIVLQQRRTGAYQQSVNLFRRAQSAGDLDADVDPEMLAVAITLLTLSDRILPQVVTMMTGLDAGSPEYRARLASFVDHLLASMDPRGER